MIMAHLLLPVPPLPSLLLLSTFLSFFHSFVATAAAAPSPSWCVTRSDASREALQRAMDYACGAGADCAPISTDGLCFLPNTIQAHASYAFNSYYHRRGMAPGSCDFAGTATIAKTDPSYGSCVYPSSSSTAGGTTIGGPPTAGTNTPTTTTTPTTTMPLSGGGGNGLNSGAGSTSPIPDESTAALRKATDSGLRIGIAALHVLAILSLTI